MRASVCILAFASALAVSAASDERPYPIDDFEGPAALSGWQFSSGPEASVAGGSLTLGPGHHEHGAVVAYRLVCGRDACGAFAEALWTPPSPLPKRHNPAISLWIRSSFDVDVSLVTRDSSGQSLQFPVPAATLESPSAAAWRYVVIPLTSDSPGKIKGRLVETGIRVQSRVAGIIQGTVTFDDIQLRESSEVFQLDPAAPLSPPPPDSAELAPRLGVNVHLLRDDHSLDLARSAGFGFVRMDMLWADVERNGRFRFFPYDALLRALDARGMGVLWILDYGHPDHGGKTPRTAQDFAAFGRFAEAAAAHFKGRNVRFEIWNEPNTAQFWTPAPNPSEYAALLREAVAAIHRADPSARVSTGGLSRIDVPFLSRAVDRNLAPNLNAIGIHPYPKAGPESIASELAILRQWMAAALGDRLEIWDTEWGYSSSNAPKEAPSNGHTPAGRKRQASLAMRELLTVWALGLPLAVWYDLHDDGPDPANPEHNYGLLDADGNEKPAAEAIRNLTSAAAGHKFAGMLPETPAGIHALRLDGTSDRTIVVWADRPGDRRIIEFARRDAVSATDLMGKPISPKNGPAGHVRIQIDEATGPIFLKGFPPYQ